MGKIVFFFVFALSMLAFGNNSGAKADTRTYGLHTISRANGVDFEKSIKCSVITQNCIVDFHWQWFSDVGFYAAIHLDSKFKNMGKINLDSVKTGTLDGTEETDNGGTLFKLRQDSLDNYVGNVWVVQLGKVDRGHANWLKYKVLDFDVLDSVNHSATMTFLWVCNIGGAANLTSPVPLDTFTDLAIFDRYDGVGVRAQSCDVQKPHSCMSNFAIRKIAQIPNLARNNGHASRILLINEIGPQIWDFCGRKLTNF